MLSAERKQRKTVCASSDRSISHSTSEHAPRDWSVSAGGDSLSVSDVFVCECCQRSGSSAKPSALPQIGVFHIQLASMRREIGPFLLAAIVFPSAMYLFANAVSGAEAAQNRLRFLRSEYFTFN